MAASRKLLALAILVASVVLASGMLLRTRGSRAVQGVRQTPVAPLIQAGSPAEAAGATGGPSLLQELSQDRLRKALKLLDQKKYREAAAELQALTETAPKDAAPWYYLGVAQAQAGRLVEACAALETAGKLQPGNKQIWADLATLYQKRSKPREAARALERAAKASPKDAGIQAMLTQVYTQLGDAQRAQAAARRAAELDPSIAAILKAQGAGAPPDLAALRAALRRNPGDVEARAQLGQMLMAAGDLEGARAAFERVAAARPKDADVLRALAKVCLAGSHAKEAVSVLTRLVAVAPKDLEARWTLANLLARSKQKEKAAAQLEAILAVKPGHVPSNLALGVLRYEQGRLPDAEKRFRAAFAAEPGNLEAAKNLSGLLRGRKRAAEAERVLRRALRAKPDAAILHALLADLLHDAGRPKESIAAYRRARSYAPDSTEITLALAEALHEAKHDADAIALLGSFLKKHPGEAPARDALATLYARRSRFDLARAQYEQVLKKDPKDQTAIARLAAVYEHEKNWAEARRQYARLLDLDWTNLDAHLATAATYLAEHNYDAAAAELEKLIAKNPRRWDAWRAMGRAMEEKKDWAGALGVYERFARQAPKDAYPVARAGWAHLQKGERDHAVQASRKALVLDPRNLEAHLVLGKALPQESAVEARTHLLAALRGAVTRNNATRREAEKRGRSQGLDPMWAAQAGSLLAEGDRVGMDAMAALRESATDEASRKATLEALQDLSKRYPRSLGLRRGIADLYGDMGRWADALPIYRTLAGETPLDPEARAQLASAYEKLGKREEALAEYRRALKLDGSLAAAQEGVKRLEEPRVELPPTKTPGWLQPKSTR